MRCAVLTILSMMLASAVFAAGIKRPHLDVRSSRNFAFTPANVIITADLRGGDDSSEQFYCPTVRWEFGDGSASEREADCPPFEPGQVVIRRHYEMPHRYTATGYLPVKIVFLRGGNVIAQGQTFITLKAGAGQPELQPDNSGDDF